MKSSHDMGAAARGWRRWDWWNRRQCRQAACVYAAVGLGGCAVVMDTDFSKYEAAIGGGAVGEGAAGHQADGGPSADATADNGADASGEASAGAGDAAPSCRDGQQNQGETDIDCGGPCSPCPATGFVHREDFNAFPNYGRDGSYEIHGRCHDDPTVPGWVITPKSSANFTRASGSYAVINTEDLAYVDLPCNDTLATPLLPTRNASNLTIEFDSSFLVETTSRASIVLVRDGKADQVWSRSYEDLNQHQRVGPLPVWGASKIRVFFRYDGQNEYFWMVDNIVITGT